MCIYLLMVPVLGDELGLSLMTKVGACLEARFPVVCIHCELLEYILSVVSSHQSYLTFQGENCDGD